MKNPFRRKQYMVIKNRPVPDEEALALVKSGVLKPHEAPGAVLRDLLRQQNVKSSSSS